MALGPLPCGVDGGFGPQLRGNPNLQRKQACPGLRLHCLTQTFAGQPADRLSDCNGTHVTVALGQRVERSPRQEGGQVRGAAPVSNNRTSAAS